MLSAPVPPRASPSPAVRHRPSRFLGVGGFMQSTGFGVDRPGSVPVIVMIVKITRGAVYDLPGLCLN